MKVIRHEIFIRNDWVKQKDGFDPWNKKERKKSKQQSALSKKKLNK